MTGRPRVAAGSGGRSYAAVALGLLALGLLAFVALPLAALAVDGLRGMAALGGGPAAGPRFGAADLAALRGSVVLSAAVSAMTVALGVPLGFLLGRSDLPGREWLRPLCTIPYAIPPYVLGIAWIRLLNPTNGLLNQAAAAVGLPAFDVYSLAGMVWVLGLAFTPFVMLATADQLSRVDATLEEAARISGASPARVLATVTLPVALPGIAASASLVFAATAAAFGLPYLLSGGADADPVLTTRIYQALALDPAHGRTEAAGLAALLALLGLGVPALLHRALGRRSFATVTGKAGRGEPFRLGRARWLGAAFAGAYAAVALVVPVAVIGATSVMRNVGGGLSPGNLTLERWAEVLLERPETVRALGNSGLLAVAAATAAVPLGALVAWTSRRTRLPGRAALSALATLPYALPGTVLALGFLLVFTQEVRLVVLERATFALALSDTLWLLGIAYVVKHLAFPVRSAGAGLDSLHPSLEEAARLSGATPERAVATITVPLLRRSLLSAWLLVFLPCFSEVTLSILLHGPRTRVVGTVLFDLQSYGDPPAAAVLAMVVIGLVAAGAALLAAFERGSGWAKSS